MQQELYQRYSPRFYALCLRYLNDTATAQEALMDGFMIIYKKIGDYTGRGSFEGWMQTIFIRTAIRYFKQSVPTEPLSESGDAVADTSVQYNYAEQIDLRTALQKVLERLTDSERTLFNMVAVEEYSFPEAARELQQPTSTTKSQYYRILNLVRKYLKQLGVVKE